MRENRTQGSVRGCWGNPASYLNMRHEPGALGEWNPDLDSGVLQNRVSVGRSLPA